MKAVGVGMAVEEMQAKIRVSAVVSPTVFHAVIAKKADILVTDVSKLKKISLPVGYVPEYYHFKSLMLLSLIQQGVVLGLLYMDWRTFKSLTDSEKAAMRSIASLLSTKI